MSTFHLVHFDSFCIKRMVYFHFLNIILIHVGISGHFKALFCFALFFFFNVRKLETIFCIAEEECSFTKTNINQLISNTIHTTSSDVFHFPSFLIYKHKKLSSMFTCLLKV